MKKHTIGIFAVISVSLLLFFQNCGKFETVSLQDELNISMLSQLSQETRQFLGLTCTINTVLSCDVNGQRGFKTCENGQFSECRTQTTITEGTLSEGITPPVKYACAGNWTLPGSTCKTPSDDYGNYIPGKVVSLFDTSGKNCGYSCECIKDYNSNTSAVSMYWSCTKDGNIVLPNVKGIIGYVPEKNLNSNVVNGLVGDYYKLEKTPSPTNSSMLVPVSPRQFNSKYSQAFSDVYIDGQFSNKRLLFSPAPIECITEINKCNITDSFEFMGITYYIVVYRSIPSEMIAELERALRLINKDFSMNFVIQDAFTTEVTKSKVRLRIQFPVGKSFAFSRLQRVFQKQITATSTTRDLVENIESEFQFFEEIGFEGNVLTMNNTKPVISTKEYKLIFDKANAFLFPFNGIESAQNYFLTPADKIYSLSLVANNLLLQLEGNFIITSLLASRQDESYNLVGSSTAIDEAKMNTICSTQRLVPNSNPQVYEKYIKNIIPSCNEWYMFMYGDGKSKLSSASEKAFQDFMMYTYRPGLKVNEFYLNPNVTRKYVSISTYLSAVEQGAEYLLKWYSLDVPKFKGGRNMTENNFILQKSLGVHPVEMYYKTYGGDLGNFIPLSVLPSWYNGPRYESDPYPDNFCLKSFGSFDQTYLYEAKTNCAYATLKAARLNKYPGVKWTELIYNDGNPVFPIVSDTDIDTKYSSDFTKNNVAEMISQGVGMYIIRLPLVRKILVSNKHPNKENYNSRGRFTTGSIQEGILNIDQSPNLTVFQFGLYYPSNFGGIGGSFYFTKDQFYGSIDYNVPDYRTSDLNYYNYATAEVGCTVLNGVYCPVVSTPAFEMQFNPENGQILSAPVNDHLHEFRNYKDTNQYFTDWKFRFENLDARALRDDQKYDSGGNHFVRIWMDSYIMKLGAVDYYNKYLINWQYELDNSPRSNHKITMYYRGFESRPPDSKMSDTPIPFSVIVGPGYSTSPR